MRKLSFNKLIIVVSALTGLWSFSRVPDPSAMGVKAYEGSDDGGELDSLSGTEPGAFNPEASKKPNDLILTNSARSGMMAAMDQTEISPDQRQPQTLTLGANPNDPKTALQPTPVPRFTPHLDGCVITIQTPIAEPPVFDESVTIQCSATSLIGYEGGYPHRAYFSLVHLATGTVIVEYSSMEGDCTYSYPPYSTCYFDFEYLWFPEPDSPHGDYSVVYGINPSGGSMCSPLSSSITITYAPCLYHGDVNFDCSVSAGDAQMAFEIALGLISPTNQVFCAADCNGDGDVTAGDAQTIFMMVLFLDSCLDPIPTCTPSPSPTFTQTVTPTPTQTPTPVVSSFVLIPAGTFDMGAPTTELCYSADEQPVHTVTLTRSFYLQTTETTQAQWIEVFGSNPSNHPGLNHPVEMISWYDATIYCNRRSIAEDFQPCYYADSDYTVIFDGTPPVTSGTVYWDQTAHGYRLPTEAEWEYACRAGTTSAYNNGLPNTSCQWNDPNLNPIAWYTSNSGSQSHEVGLKQPNAWGLYDMPGNVYEYCWDAWVSDYYSYSPAIDPTGPPANSWPIVRGGNYKGAATYGRSAKRYHTVNYARYVNCGLRLARTNEGNLP